MLKSFILAGSMMVAAPVLAQDAAGTQPMAPSASPAPSTTPQGAAPAQPAAPAPVATTAAAAPAQPGGAATESAAATGADQVASIVNAEFASYDKDRNGTLDKTEFAAWMDALKAKAPNAADKPADPKWNDAAFAQADKDKSASLTRDELSGFLGSPATAGSQ